MRPTYTAEPDPGRHSRRGRRGDQERPCSGSVDTLQSSRASGIPDRDVARIVHELRAPLTSLRLLTEDMIHRCAASGAERAGDLDRLHGIITGMATTVDTLLEAMHLKQDAADWGDVDIARCCRAAIDLVRPQASARTRITLDISGNLPRMQGSASSIGRLLVNLLANACRHTTAGRIAVMAHSEPGGWLSVSVTDTGAGVHRAVLGRLGEPFARGPEPDGGSGLGLWICRMIAAMHGGYICISSSQNGGTTALVRLRTGLREPISNEAPAPIRIAPPLAARSAA